MKVSDIPIRNWPDSLGAPALCNVSHLDSFLWLQLSDTLDEVERLSELGAHWAENPAAKLLQKHQLELGCIYLFEWDEDGAFYRGMLEGNGVRFVDFGNTANVGKVYDLSEELKKIPLVARKFSPIAWSKRKDVDYEVTVRFLSKPDEEDLSVVVVESWETDPKYSYIPFKDELVNFKVSYVGEDSNAIWVMLESAEAVQKLMAVVIDDMYGIMNPAPCLDIGTIVIAKYEQDDSEYHCRARILELDGDFAEVFYIDFGNTWNCPKADIYEYEADKFHNIPQTASKMDKPFTPSQISYIKEKYPKLTNGDEILLVNVKKCKRDLLTVNDILLSSGEDLIKSIPVVGDAPPSLSISGSDIGSVKSAKTATSGASTSTTSTKRVGTKAAPVGRSEKGKIMYQKVTGTKNFVILSMIEDSNGVYFLGTQNVEDVDEYTEELNIIEKIAFEDFKVGDYCLIPLEEGTSRAQIIGINGNEVDVIYIDFGYYDTTQRDMICQLPDNHYKKAFSSCIEVQEMTDELRRQFNEDIDGENFAWRISLIRENEKTGRPICAIEVQRGEGQGFVPVLQNHLVNEIRKPKLEFMKPTFHPERSFPVLLFEFSEEEFAFQVQDSSRDLDILAGLLEGVESQEKLTRPDIDLSIIAKFSEDGEWYRATILEMTANAFKVRYIDYGNSEIIKIDEMAERCRLPTEFQVNEPVFSFFVVLPDISDELLNIFEKPTEVNAIIEKIWKDDDKCALAGAKFVRENDLVQADIIVDGQNIKHFLISDDGIQSHSPSHQPSTSERQYTEDVESVDDGDSIRSSNSSLAPTAEKYLGVSEVEKIDHERSEISTEQMEADNSTFGLNTTTQSVKTSIDTTQEESVLPESEESQHMNSALVDHLVKVGAYEMRSNGVVEITILKAEVRGDYVVISGYGQKDEDELVEITQEITEKLPIKPLLAPTVGQMVAVPFEIYDGDMVRGKIESIKGQFAQVRLVDYGQVCLIGIQSIFKLIVEPKPQWERSFGIEAAIPIECDVSYAKEVLDEAELDSPPFVINLQNEFLEVEGSQIQKALPLWGTDPGDFTQILKPLVVPEPLCRESATLDPSTAESTPTTADPTTSSMAAKAKVKTQPVSESSISEAFTDHDDLVIGETYDVIILQAPIADDSLEKTVRVCEKKRWISITSEIEKMKNTFLPMENPSIGDQVILMAIPFRGQIEQCPLRCIVERDLQNGRFLLKAIDLGRRFEAKRNRIYECDESIFEWDAVSWMHVVFKDQDIMKLMSGAVYPIRVTRRRSEVIHDVAILGDGLNIHNKIAKLFEKMQAATKDAQSEFSKKEYFASLHELQILGTDLF